jgi:hypothetical protein
MSLRPTVLVALAILTACGSSNSDVKPPEAAPPAADAPPPFNPAEAAAAAENIALVPSVVETQRALDAAGVQTQLATLITARAFDVKNENLDNVAIRTGVILADMMLTVKTSSNEQLLDQIAKIKAGMQTLQGGADIQNILTELEEGVKGGSVTRDDLLKQLDELAGAAIPELEFNGQKRVVPLIQAGSWLEGANLVGKAVEAAGKPDAADAMLKQPAVVDYFIKYVKTEGQEKAPAAIAQKLEQSLTTLKGLAEKKEPFTAEDLATVVKTTDEVLALL